MRKSKLMSRQKEIIQILTKSTIKNPITVSAIAEKLNVSSRTVLREIPKIEKWLDENGFNFIKKPGVGLIIDENLENQQLILELLEVENVEKDYSKEERQRIILGELLINKEPLKLFYFTSLLKVSEGTLSNDLDTIEEWLKNFNIKLIRKQGLGIYLEGEEKNYRRALSNILYDTLEEKEMISLVKDSLGSARNKESIELSIENRLLRFIDKSIIKDIEKILSELENQYEFKMLDSTYIGLVVHLSLAIQRIQNNEKIIMDKNALNELQFLPEFSLGEKISKELEKCFDIQIPKDEIGYITMHLKGAKLRLSKVENDIDLDNLDIKQIVSYIISEVEKDFGIEIKNRKKLSTDLLNHLVPAVSRLTMKLNIRNPLLDKIKEQYSDVYKSCERACEILKKITNVDKIPESEVAYVAIHIAASLEENMKDEKFSVVIACPTGIGTSRLLAANVKKEFDNLDIKGTISAINIDIGNLKSQGIDFIITTVDLEVDYKYVCVNPIFLDRDKIILKDFIHRLSKDRVHNALKNKESRCDKEKIESITSLGADIIKILENVKVKELDSIDSTKSIIKEASKIFAQNDEQAESIENSLIAREAISSTYISAFNIMFLHCKNENVFSCKFGVLRFNNTFIEEEKKVNYAIVSLIPENNTQMQIDIMGHISSEIIEKESFRKIIKEDNERNLKKNLENILSDFYKRKLKQIMEG